MNNQEPQWERRYNPSRKLFSIRRLTREDAQFFIEYLLGEELPRAVPAPRPKIEVPAEVFESVAQQCFGKCYAELRSADKRCVTRNAKRVVKGKPIRVPDHEKAEFKKALAQLDKAASAKKRANKMKVSRRRKKAKKCAK